MIRTGRAPSATRRPHELVLAHRQDSAAHQPRDGRPADQHHDQQDAIEAGALGVREIRRDAELGQVDRRQHDQQRQQRQRDHRIGKAHQQRVDAAAEIACDDADQRAEHRSRDRADQADEQGHLAAVEQAQQKVAAELVGAQRMAGARDGEAAEQVDQVGIVAEQRRDQRRRQAGQREQHQHRRAGHAQAMAQEAAQQHPAGRNAGTGRATRAAAASGACGPHFA